MHREFLDLYNKELELFYEHAVAFGQENPTTAGRLGGITRERSDPMLAALLEGAAFLAARVQLKIRHEFPEFTNNLIEQLLPNFLAPTPSVLLARVEPPFGDPALREGRMLKRGALLNAVYPGPDKHVTCRFSLSSNLTLWPFEITHAEYHTTPTQLQALGVEGDFKAGLQLTLRLRTAPRLEDEASDEAARQDPASLFAGCRVSRLPVYLLGAENDAAALYEQIFAQRVGLHIRYADGESRVLDTRDVKIEPVGFDEDELLLPSDPRLFRGFSLLQEYFLFPRKFLGFRLTTGQGELFPVPARELDIVLTFREAMPRLAAAVKPGMFALHAAPAVNLFPMTMNRVPVSPSEHEHHVIPDRGRPFDFEPHTVLEVFAHYAGHSRRERLSPLYTATTADISPSPLRYTVRRLPRRRTSDERRFGSASDYLGTDMFLSLGIPSAGGEEDRVQELSVRGLCSNRHLADRMPAGGTEFAFAEDTSLAVVCVSGPTRPQAPLLHRGDEPGHSAWQLINTLSLNHVGLMRADGQALREVLALFGDASDRAVGQRIRGLRGVSQRPVVRRVKSRHGIGAARGIEVTVTFDEKAFEGSGVYLLGAVLEHFFAEYAQLNHFTQTVLATLERGEIARWPPRAGGRRAL